MAEKSSIEWTDATWNPVTGCSVVSPGCTNCYAMKLAGTRLKNHPSRKGLTTMGKAGPVWNGRISINEQWLTQPLGWKTPRMVFVAAHGDLFHENVPDEVIDRIFAVMALCPQHTFQVLTKRPERMRDYVDSRSRLLAGNIGGNAVDIMLEHESESAGAIKTTYPARAMDYREIAIEAIYGGLSNVWLGVSAEDQTRADERIPLLLDTPAAIRFVSAEPLLGPIDLRRWLSISWQCSSCRGYFAGRYFSTCPECGAEGGWTGSHKFNGRGRPKGTLFPPQSGRGLDWIIVGGESKAGARPMHPDWARDLRDQCAAPGGAEAEGRQGTENGVPFFFKQWGDWLPWAPEHGPTWKAQNGDSEDGLALFPDDMDKDRKWDSGLWAIREELEHFAFQNVGTKRAGRLLDGVKHNGFPAPRHPPARPEDPLPPVPHDLASGEIG
jgi:protein gp37